MKEFNEMSLKELFKLEIDIKEAIEKHPNRKYCPWEHCRKEMVEDNYSWKCSCGNIVQKDWWEGKY